MGMRRKPSGLHASISITNVPELVWIVRRELAQVLREVAEDEDERVAQRLREIAALFETGQTTDPI